MRPFAEYGAEERFLGFEGLEGRVYDGPRVVVAQLVVEVLEALDDAFEHIRLSVPGVEVQTSAVRVLTSLMLIVSY